MAALETTPENSHYACAAKEEDRALISGVRAMTLYKMVRKGVGVNKNYLLNDRKSQTWLWCH